MSQEILKSLFTSLPKQERIKELDTLASILNTHHKATLAVNFICTHNSRRSHFSEILFRTAAKYYGIKNVETYSGGTEGTALYVEVAESFKRHGFTVVKRFRSQQSTLADLPPAFRKRGQYAFFVF